jgi:transcriptional regulator with GAF, ATPase, and Fis domain
MTFERFIADQALRFAGLPNGRVHAEIEQALSQLVEFLGTERSSFFELLPDTDVIAVTKTWAKPGVDAIGPPLVMAGAYPWYTEQLRKGETIRFDRIPDDVPPEAVLETEYAISHGLRSHVCIPLAVNGRWMCALGSGTFTKFFSWSDAIVLQMRAVGQILANALYRERIETELQDSIRQLRQLQERLTAENEYLREETERDAGFEEIVGRTPALRSALAQAARVAPMPTAVLLLGETGTGKELLARAIHARSPRGARALIKLNCASLPLSLVESELFGHEKGAFTGATSSRAGRFELADGGTLFLDEIAELPLEAQAKLLRVLQDGEFERLGSVRTRRVDVRLIAATNRDLERAIAEGRFREDLYYRLAAFPIRVPPLRERSEDVPYLVWDFIHQRQAELGRHIEHVSEDAMRRLVAWPWPGNVRELRNVIERALILSDGSTLELDASFGGTVAERVAAESLEDIERKHIARVLDRCGWRINGAGNAAEQLGLHPNTLRSRLKRLGVERPDPRAPRAN